MFNRKSSYALNKKDPNAIVYMDANEVIIRLTREDFASEKEFLKWKALSDEDYHASEKEAHVYSKAEALATAETTASKLRVPAGPRRRRTASTRPWRAAAVWRLLFCSRGFSPSRI